MPPITFADNFLAGSILSLVLPAGLLVAFAIWYVLTVMRMSGRRVAELVEDLDRVVNPDPSADSDPPDATPPATRP
jgi:hypothetical protein